MKFIHTKKLYEKSDLSDICIEGGMSYLVEGMGVCILPDTKKSPWAKCKYHTPKQEEIYWLKQSQEILSESQDEFVIIENNYNNRVIENHKIVEKYFQDPENKELLQKLYDLINYQYNQMKLNPSTKN